MFKTQVSLNKLAKQINNSSYFISWSWKEQPKTYILILQDRTVSFYGKFFIFCGGGGGGGGGRGENGKEGGIRFCSNQSGSEAGLSWPRVAITRCYFSHLERNHSFPLAIKTVEKTLPWAWTTSIQTSWVEASSLTDKRPLNLNMTYESSYFRMTGLHICGLMHTIQCMGLKSKGVEIKDATYLPGEVFVFVFSANTVNSA